MDVMARRRTGSKILPIVIAGFLTAAFAVGPSVTSGVTPTEGYAKHRPDHTPYVNTREMASYIAAHSSASDTVLMWGADSAINALAQRKSPTRFKVADALFVPGPELLRYRQLFIIEISQAPPKFVVIECQSPWPATQKHGYELVRAFPAFQSFLQEFYYLDRNFGAYDLWAFK